MSNKFVFIDIGYKRHGFLYLDDKKEENLDFLDKFENINHNLKEGCEILVQVIRDSNSLKGPTLTTQISVTGKFCVMFFSVKNRKNFISKKIVHNLEKKRLTDIFFKFLPQNYKVIIRIQVQDVSEFGNLSDFFLNSISRDNKEMA